VLGEAREDDYAPTCANRSRTSNAGIVFGAFGYSKNAADIKALGCNSKIGGSPFR
jgi:hypothetical protein